jgi:hypothetical protein
MDRAEYQQLKQRAETEYRENVNAIERVWAMSQVADPSTNGAADSPPRPRRPYTRRKKAGAGKGALIKAVRTAIDELEGKFTFRQVHEAILNRNRSLVVKRTTLKATMKRLADAGELVIVTQGIGRRATVYLKGNS